MEDASIRDQKHFAHLGRILPRPIFESLRYFENAIVVKGKKKKPTHLVITEDALYLVSKGDARLPPPILLTDVVEIQAPMDDASQVLVEKMALHSQHILLRAREYPDRPEIASTIDCWTWIEDSTLLYHLEHAVAVAHVRAIRGSQFNAEACMLVNETRVDPETAKREGRTPLVISPRSARGERLTLAMRSTAKTFSKVAKLTTMGKAQRARLREAEEERKREEERRAAEDVVRRPTRELYKEIESEILHARTMAERARLVDELGLAVDNSYLLKRLFFENDAVWNLMCTELATYARPFPSSVRSVEHLKERYTRADELDYILIIIDLITRAVFTSEPLQERFALLNHTPPHSIGDIVEILTQPWTDDLAAPQSNETPRPGSARFAGLASTAHIIESARSGLSETAASTSRGRSATVAVSRLSIPEGNDAAPAVPPSPAGSELEQPLSEMPAPPSKPPGVPGINLARLGGAGLVGEDESPRTRLQNMKDAESGRTTASGVGNAPGTGSRLSARLAKSIWSMKKGRSDADRLAETEQRQRAYRNVVKRVHRIQKAVYSLVYELQCVAEHGWLKFFREGGYIIQNLAGLQSWREGGYSRMVMTLIDCIGRAHRNNERTIMMFHITSVIFSLVKQPQAAKDFVETCSEEFRYFLSNPAFLQNLDTDDFLENRTLELIYELLELFPPIDIPLAAEY